MRNRWSGGCVTWKIGCIRKLRFSLQLLRIRTRILANGLLLLFALVRFQNVWNLPRPVVVLSELLQPGCCLGIVLAIVQAGGRFGGGRSGEPLRQPASFVRTGRVTGRLYYDLFFKKGLKPKTTNLVFINQFQCSSLLWITFHKLCFTQKNQSKSSFEIFIVLR